MTASPAIASHDTRPPRPGTCKPSVGRDEDTRAPTTTFEVALCALRGSGSSPGGRQPSGFVATSSLVLMTLWLC